MRARHPAAALLFAGAVLLAAALLTLGGLAGSAAAQPPACPEGQPGDTVGTHVVVEGETLQKITEKYLGTVVLWTDNWQLNPEIRDPDRLRIGQRVCVIVERQPRQRTATVKKVKPIVKEKRPEEVAWIRDAEVGNELLEGDGVRTYEDASADLELEDERHVTVGEETVVFLRRMTTTVTHAPLDEIVIEEGQADLEAQLRHPRSPGIEIIVGGTTARPEPDPLGRLENRARRAGEGEAQLMAYTGSAEVRSRGGRVLVPEGMGTRVVEGEAPLSPEKLLPAPVPESPASRSRWDYANPLFSWWPVEGAASYVVEVCRDPECGALEAREPGLTETTWQARPLPVGTLYWRVTAVSPSGLDGYPSRTRRFAVTSSRIDLGPPTVALRPSGPGVSRGGSLRLGPGSRVALDVHDDASGVAEVRTRWDGGEWRRWDGGLLDPPAGPAPRRLEVEADDHLGRTSEALAATVETVTEPPEAPRAGVAPGRGLRLAAGVAPGTAAPPAVAAVVAGPGQVRQGGGVVLGSGGRLRLETRGEGAEVYYRWDGGEWRRWQGEELAPPGPGAHTLDLTAGPPEAGAAITTLAVETSAAPPPAPRTAS